jgi:hypothetical protein
MNDAIQNFFNSFQPLYNKNKYEVDYHFKDKVKKILIGFYFQDAQKYYYNLPTLKQVLDYDYETTNFGRGLRSKATRKLNENEQKFFERVFEIIEKNSLKPIKQNVPPEPLLPLVDWNKPPEPLVPLFDLPMVRYWLNDDDYQPNLVSDLRLSSKFPPLSPSQSQTSSPKKDIEKFINSLPRSIVSSVASLGSIAFIASSITEYGNSPKQMKSSPKSQEKERKFENFEDSDVMIEEDTDSDDTIVITDSD